MAAAASRKRPPSGDACPAATEASAFSTSPASEGARPAATEASASSTSPASEGACPTASASSTNPASEGACSAATEASASSTSPASEGGCSAATDASASSTSPASEGACPAATASRKRPAPEEACPAAAPAAPKKRARYSFSNIQDYKMLNELGAGAFGVVTRARHRRTGETVAIKWIRGGFDAFVREAGCLAACRGHPSIVQIRDAATDAATGDLFLVMEFVGPCLRDWLTRPVSEDVARSFMRQLLSAAAKMHAAPMAMIHRDIKPENILVSVSGKLKICDFGCATPAAPAGTPYPEQWVGTLPYCAPEQLKGGRCYGSAVDMWALGCLMIEMLIGVDLFTADTEEGMLLQIKDLQEGIACIGSKAFNDLLGLSPAGIDLLAGLLSVEPDKRPTAPEALAHRWFTEAAAESPAAAKAEFPGFVPLFSES